jgi:hypothetical protein
VLVGALTHALGGDASPIEAAFAMTLAGKRAIPRPAKMTG